MNTNKIEIKNMTILDRKGIITNQQQPIPDRYKPVVAECIMQVLYNLAAQSQIDLNYDMEVGGTKYMIHGTDVTIVPLEGEPMKRRIKNDRSLVSNHSKE